MSKGLFPTRDISAKEYNEKYRWDCDGAYCFVKGLEHAMQKSGAFEEAMHQLRCMGWPKHQETLLKAIEVYRVVAKSKIPGHHHYEFRHVVLCKDCKHWKGYEPYKQSGVCKKWKLIKSDCGFCDCAERKCEEVSE